MAVNFLDFEQPIAELEAKIEELKHVPSGTAVNIQEEISRLKQKTAYEILRCLVGSEMCIRDRYWCSTKKGTSGLIGRF